MKSIAGLILFWLCISDADAFERYAQGSLIVKYSDQVGACVHSLVQQHRSFQGVLTHGGSSLDALHSKFHVLSAEPIFRQPSGENDSSVYALRRDQQSQFDRIRNKFPLRTARGPAGATIPDLYHIYLLTLPPYINIKQAVAEFSLDPNVVYAQPNYILHADFTPNDPYYGSSGAWGQSYGDLWALKGNKLNLRTAWDLSQGKNITVAVVDTGLDYRHPDIQGNVWSNPGEIPGNQRDDDGNGFVDDVRGWNFVRDPGERHSDPLDDNGHGTHVSGTIAAVGNNKIGIIGVAPKAKIMPVKALRDDGSGENVALGLAILYAASNGADVINNSWGCSYCPTNPVIEEVVRTAHTLGAVVVFAAGNNRCDVSVKSPQNMTTSKPIVVAASTEKDQPAYFSCFGAQVDVAAPGGGSEESPEDVASILSLKAQHSHFDPGLTVGKQYLRLAGTSMAAPHVSGVAALMLSHNPSLRNEDVRLLLRASSRDIYKPEFDEHTGAGRVDAAKALQLASTLNVKIISPKSGSNFSQSRNPISVKGTATGPDFDQCELFYRPIQSDDWISLGPSRSTPFKNAGVGEWNVSQMSSGVYLLRLVATSQTGVRYEDVVEVGLDRPHRIINTNRGSNPNIEGGRPRISDNRIAWEELGVPRGVNVFDLSRNQQQLVLTGGNAPDLSGDLLVASHRYRERILLYNFATQATTSIDPGKGANGIRIAGNHLAWNTSSVTGRDISHCVYQPQTGSCPAQQITTNPKTQWNAEISENVIVWEDFRNASRSQSQNSDVYLYDLSSGTEHQVTTNSREQVQPQASGNRIVWMDMRNGNWDIYMCAFDASTRTCQEERVTADPTSQLYPSISGDRIVWSDFRSGNPDIFEYNINTKLETQLTFSTRGQLYPRISGNNVIWLEVEGDESVRIYYEALQP